MNEQKVFVYALILLLIGFALFAAWQYYMAMPAPEKPPKYTEDLFVHFTIRDATSGTQITSDVYAEFYPAGTNPMARDFIGTPIATATYDATEGAWEVILDAGSYVLLVYDAKASKTLYPVLVPVTVKGTDREDRTVWLDPSLIDMYQRATIASSVTIKGWNTATSAWETDTAINFTKYDKWHLTFEFSISGVKQLIKGGRFYLPTYDGFTYTYAWIDGVQVSIGYDSVSSDDGMTGYYIVFPDWLSGEWHRIDIQIDETGTPSTGTMTYTLFEYYACLLPTLRWWTDTTISVSVVS